MSGLFLLNPGMNAGIFSVLNLSAGVVFDDAHDLDRNRDLHIGLITTTAVTCKGMLLPCTCGVQPPAHLSQSMIMTHGVSSSP